MAQKKKITLAYGEGTIYQRKVDGLWCASLYLGPESKRRYFYGKTEGAVADKMLKAKRNAAKDGGMADGSQSVATWINYWFEHIASKKLRPRTAPTYRGYIDNHILPAIGKVRLDKLTPAHVRKVHQAMEDKGLAAASIGQAHRILSVALKYAEREGKVMKNVAMLTDAPQKKRKEMKSLSPAQGVKVMQTAAQPLPDGSVPRHTARWAAALLTGARQGELLGLEIDRVGSVMDLSWQLQRLNYHHGCGPLTDGAYQCGARRAGSCPDRKIKFPRGWEHRHLTGGLYLSRPKSDAGWRVVPLVEPLRSMLHARIEQAASEPNPHGLLWTADPKLDRATGTQALDGKPIDPRADSEAWHELLKRAGVPDVRLHDARHTTASLLLKAGVPPALQVKIMGHSTYATTMGYQHMEIEQLEQAMQSLTAQYQIPELPQ